MSDDKQKLILNIPDSFTDITPEESIVPIYRDSAPAIPILEGPDKSPDQMFQEQLILKNSAIKTLVKMGLSLEEARLIVGT